MYVRISAFSGYRASGYRTLTVLGYLVSAKIDHSTSKQVRFLNGNCIQTPSKNQTVRFFNDLFQDTNFATILNGRPFCFWVVNSGPGEKNPAKLDRFIHKKTGPFHFRTKISHSKTRLVWYWDGQHIYSEHSAKLDHFIQKKTRAFHFRTKIGHSNKTLVCWLDRQRILSEN
jgi:hypothetical protein